MDCEVCGSDYGTIAVFLNCYQVRLCPSCNRKITLAVLCEPFFQDYMTAEAETRACIARGDVDGAVKAKDGIIGTQIAAMAKVRTIISDVKRSLNL